MQKCKIIKGSSKQYHKIETQLNEWIEQGYIIEKISSVVVGEHRSGLTSNTIETEILVFVILKEVEINE